MIIFFWRIGWYEEKRDGVSFWSTWELGWARQQVKVLLVLVVLMLWIFFGEKRGWCHGAWIIYLSWELYGFLCVQKKKENESRIFICAWRVCGVPSRENRFAVVCCVVWWCVANSDWLEYAERSRIVNWWWYEYILCTYTLLTFSLLIWSSSPSSWSYQACVTMSPTAFIPFFILASYFYLFSRGRKKCRRNFLKP